MNIATWLQRTALAQPDAPGLFRGADQVATYGGFAAMAAALARGLRVEYGIGPGDRIGLFMSNDVEYLVILFGIWWAGAVPVPINAKLHEAEAAWILTDAGAKLTFVSGHGDATSPDPIRVGEPNVARIAIKSSRYSELLKHSAEMHIAERSDDDLAWLFYTSGTTGRPKGVMLSHGNLVAMTQSFIVDVDDPTPGEAHFYAAPMSHGSGLYSLVYVLRGAAHIVAPNNRFDPGVLLELAAHFGNLSLFAVPTMVKRLVDYARATNSRGDGLRTIVYGGGPMYVPDIEAAVAVFGPRFIQIYGQGETPMTITTLSRGQIANCELDGWRERLGSVGRAFSGHEVRVADPNGKALPAGEAGEILVRGATVMKGYWNNPEASGSALRDGWLWTGDVGVLSGDGYLTLKDRSKDVIISGGTNIYPREIEEALLTHPDVAEVCVIGRPDPEWGEEVVAFVVASKGCMLDERILDEHCLMHIARFKRPKHYRFTDRLPKSDYGKVLKTSLRRLLFNE